MTRRNLLVALGAVLAAPLLFWLLNGRTAANGRFEPRIEHGDVAGETAPKLASGLESAASGLEALEIDAGGANGERRAVDGAASEAPPRVWPEHETRWLAVRVVAPPGTPRGEAVRVAALAAVDGEAPGPDRVRRALDALEAGGDPRRVPGVLAAITTETGVDARLGLPPEAEEAWLFGAGRYLHSFAPRLVALPDAGEAGAAVELRLALGALVTGRVTPPSGSPDVALQGIEVGLDWSLNAALQLGAAKAVELDREVETDATGYFEFRAVPVGKPQLVTAEPALFAHAFYEFEARPGQHVEVDLTCLAGATVRGRVVDEAGKPLAGAEVEAVGREFFGTPTHDLRKTEADAEGHFVLAGLTPGNLWLHAEHGDYQELLSPMFEVADREERDYGDLVLQSGLVVAGTVRFPEGAPAAGATVTVKPDMGENMSGTAANPRAFIGAGNDATVDATGSFRIVGLGKGPWALTAEHEGEPGEPRSGRWSGHRALVRAPIEGLALTLDPPIGVDGVVVDSAGEPVTDFMVSGERAGSQWYMPPSEKESDEYEVEDGRFRLEGLRAGKWTFTAEAEGYARSPEVELTLPTEESLRLVLSRPVELAGTVVDPEGRLVAGAEVSRELEGTEVFEAMQGRGDWTVVRTDDEGAFVLDDLPPGTGAIVAKKDGFAPSAVFPFELAEGDAQRGIVLELRTGGTISGEIFEQDGSAAKGCMVILQQPTMAERRITNADARGRFEEAGLTPGTWQVQAFPGVTSPNSASDESFDQVALMKALQMTTVELDDLATEHVILGAPPADPVRVRGSVTLDDEPLDGLMISFVAAGSAGKNMLKITQTDADGEYELRLDEPGDYLVTVQTVETAGQPNSIEFRRNVPQAEEHQLDFALPLGRVSGRVVDTRGKPLEGVRVTLSMQSGQVFGTVFGGQYDESTTNADGRYEILFLRPGEYALSAGGAHFGGMMGDGGGFGRVVRTVLVGENEWVENFDFELERPGTVTGVVRDPGGQPVADATIFVRDERGRLVELFSMIRTNGSGRFEYTGLAPGRYTLTARTQERSSLDTEALRVRSGEETKAAIVVHPGTILLVSLEDKSGADLPSRVSVLDANHREMNGMLGLEEIMQRYSGGLDDAAQRVGPLPPGTYRVEAIAADGRSASKQVTLSGQDERKLKLRLR